MSSFFYRSFDLTASFQKFSNFVGPRSSRLVGPIVAGTIYDSSADRAEFLCRLFGQKKFSEIWEKVWKWLTTTFLPEPLFPLILERFFFSSSEKFLFLKNISAACWSLSSSGRLGSDHSTPDFPDAVRPTFNELFEFKFDDEEWSDAQNSFAIVRARLSRYFPLKGVKA